MRLVVSAQESIPESWRSRFELVTADELPPGEDFHLRFTDDALRLCRGRDARGICVRADDIHRRLKGDFLLGRACVAGAGGRVHVLDAMAGLGIDGVALALRGHRVTLVERNVVLWALLDDLLRRLDLADVDLHCADSRELFLTPTVSDRVFDVVYLDPMFPARSKGALPGKNMQYVSALLDATEETESTATNPAITRLVELAQSSAASHVVLKRRRKEPVLLTPDWQIKGRSVRYDMFRSRAG